MTTGAKSYLSLTIFCSNGKQPQYFHHLPTHNFFFVSGFLGLPQHKSVIMLEVTTYRFLIVTQQNVLELAKQGNPQAIAALMNHHLQPRGITAKATVKNGCLQIILESAQVPEQQAMVAFVRKGMSNLRVAFIHKVRVCGRQTDLGFTVWVEEFNLATAKSTRAPYPTYCTQSQNQRKDITPVNQAKSYREKAQVFLGGWILVLLFGGCVHQVGYPWNCADAREAVQKAQSDYGDNYKKQSAKVYADREGIASLYLNQATLNQAERKAQDLCKN